MVKTEYTLKCLGSGTAIEDIDMRLESGIGDVPAFLRTIYYDKQLDLDSHEEGVYRFSSWLPVRRTLEGSSAPLTYKSEAFAGHLGLDNLFVTFNGFWPERGARMATGTFKECEAYSVCARLPDDFSETLVIASAGNTARAFIQVCSRNSIPLIAVIPESALPSLRIDHHVDPCVKVVVATDGADYFDAISISQTICAMDGFRAEGGAKNVARRDGMGTTVLSAVTYIGAIPSYYFQAVGSGTGAIAAWEANQRLLEDGRFGSERMRLMVSQNEPFLVIYDSWKRGSRELVEISAEEARRSASAAYAKVLSNRHPPYSVIGGLYDALIDTGGDVLKVTNEEAKRSAAAFEALEGIDIAPAAAVAAASLEASVKAGEVLRDDLIMLNITGGGYKRAEEALDLRQVESDLELSADDRSSEAVARAISKLY